MSIQTCGFGALIVAVIGFLVPSVVAAQCAGDCGRDNRVQVAEVITCVGAALSTLPLTQCNECDVNGDGGVTVEELIAAVRAVLDGCPCPLAAGEYRLTQRADGEMQVIGSPWVVPKGGTITLEVDEAESPACPHAVWVPFPGGLELPTFCPGLSGYTAQITQTGCGVGQIVSGDRGGYDVTAVADTSDTSGVCSTVGSVCRLGPTPDDSAIRVHLSVAEGGALCAAERPVEIVLTIPIRVLYWIDADAPCVGRYDPDKDMLIGDWPMIWDLTTGTATSFFADLDGDGCAGYPYGRGFSRTGTCFDASARNDGEASAVMVAAGAASVGIPLYDMTFALTMPVSLTGPTGRPPPVSPCQSAPPIIFGGAVDRCLSE
jgi:hypothetical protein